MYQAIRLGMGSKKEVEENYSYEQIVSFLTLSTYENYVERKQQLPEH